MSVAACTPASISVSELDAKLTGTWTLLFEGQSDPDCLTINGLWTRRVDGSMETSEPELQGMSKNIWTMDKAYGSDLGAVRINHPDEAPIYWVVQFRGKSMKTSNILSSPPENKSDALEALAKPDPKNPDIKRPIMYKCYN